MESFLVKISIKLDVIREILVHLAQELEGGLGCFIPLYDSYVVLIQRMELFLWLSGCNTLKIHR